MKTKRVPINGKRLTATNHVLVQAPALYDPTFSPAQIVGKVADRVAATLRASTDNAAKFAAEAKKPNRAVRFTVIADIVDTTPPDDDVDG